MATSTCSSPTRDIRCSRSRPATSTDRSRSLEAREPVGVSREALPHEGVTRMANLNGSHVVDDAAGRRRAASISARTAARRSEQPTPARLDQRGGRTVCRSAVLHRDEARRMAAEPSLRLSVLPASDPVEVDPRPSALQAIAGRFEVTDADIYFTPRFPFVDGTDVFGTRRLANGRRAVSILRPRSPGLLLDRRCRRSRQLRPSSHSTSSSSTSSSRIP